jgi:hypothetical protein
MESGHAKQLPSINADLEVEEEEAESEPEPEICELDRPERKDCTDCCSICGEDNDTAKPHERMLEIELTDLYIILCSKHEGIFLRKLLNNYVKRQQKKSKTGFTGPLAKDLGPVCEVPNGA